ncbi:mortality factor 4-like protein 2 [Macrotis lagotis]|uniref:mortality factor 4-like protein 2 n=1 Tax=Macrotis lagotis TaxID=92651 RepID=UPI003D686B44
MAAKAQDADVMKAPETGIKKGRDVDVIKAQDADAHKAQDADAGKARDTGVIKAQDANALTTRDAGTSKARDAGAVKDQGTGTSKPGEAGAVKARGADALTARDAGTSKARDAGAVKDQGTGTSKPGEAGAVKARGADALTARDAGTSKARDAGGVKDRDTGTGKAGDAGSQAKSAKGKVRAPSSSKISEGPEQNPLDSGEDPSRIKQAKSAVTETHSDSTRGRAGTKSSKVPPCFQWRRSLLGTACQTQEELPTTPEFKIVIPSELKHWLVEDWHLITVQKKLFSLPAKINVETILENYEQYERGYASSEDVIYAVPEMIEGLRLYFNLTLGTHLLYKFEKPQNSTIMAQNPNSTMAHLYGAPHLLRLFVKIGDMLSSTFIHCHSTNLQLKCMHSFVAYLANNKATLFNSNDYELASPDYLQVAEQQP